jgi:uncharacterized protein YozE (UPF0346 family)
MKSWINVTITIFDDFHIFSAKNGNFRRLSHIFRENGNFRQLSTIFDEKWQIFYEKTLFT